jgi:hypothetical protein
MRDDWRSSFEGIMGYSPDISEHIEFDFHGWIKYYDPQKGEQLGKWLGVARNVGQAMTYWILTDKMTILARSTIRPITKEEWLCPIEKRARDQFDEVETEKLGQFDESLIHQAETDEMEMQMAEDNEVMNNKDTENDRNEQLHGPDELRGAEIYLPHGDRTEIAKVLGRKRDANGNFIGRRHRNPILDSRVFVVEFPDGQQKDVSFNVLAEHLYSQVDEEGNIHRLYKGIVAHRKLPSAVDKADQFRQIGNKRVKKKTTAGWEVEIEWKDGTTSWLPMKEVKATNSVELAEYAVANRIDSEPAFDWWVKPTLKRKKRLIKLSQKHHARTGYKFGI